MCLASALQTSYAMCMLDIDMFACPASHKSKSQQCNKTPPIQELVRMHEPMSIKEQDLEFWHLCRDVLCSYAFYVINDDTAEISRVCGLPRCRECQSLSKASSLSQTWSRAAAKFSRWSAAASVCTALHYCSEPRTRNTTPSLCDWTSPKVQEVMLEFLWRHQKWRHGWTWTLGTNTHWIQWVVQGRKECKDILRASDISWKNYEKHERNRLQKYKKTDLKCIFVIWKKCTQSAAQSLPHWEQSQQQHWQDLNVNPLGNKCRP